MKEELFSLYKSCFPEDSEGCSEYIYKNRLNKSECLYEICDGKIVAAEWLVNKTLVFNGAKIKIPHIVGLCTDKDYRYRGYAKKLLVRAFERAQDSPFITLYPFSHAFYERFGFAAVSFDFPAPDPSNARRAEASDIISSYNSLTRGLYYYIERKNEDFEFYDGVYATDGVYCKADENGIYTPDGFLPREFSQTDIKGVMARVTNVKKALSLTGCSAPYPITVKDEFIEKNNVTFTLNSGRTEATDEKGRLTDIKDLTTAIFGKNVNFYDVFPYKCGYLADKY